MDFESAMQTFAEAWVTAAAAASAKSSEEGSAATSAPSSTVIENNNVTETKCNGVEEVAGDTAAAKEIKVIE